MFNLNKIGAVILAAGKGTRLNCTEIPKVLLSLAGKPIVGYTVDNLEKAGFGKKQICLVIGFKKEKVKEYFGDEYIYAVQDQQLGTAHATYTGMKQLPSEIEDVLVMGGDDSAFYKPETFLKLIEKHLESKSVLTLLSAENNDPSLGRIVRHENGDIEIIEKEYLTEEQKKINEISTGTFCFNRKWFEEIFPVMPQLRKLGEYGLPTALAIARDTKQSYQVIKLEDDSEWFGINTVEQLKTADLRKNNVKILS